MYIATLSGWRFVLMLPEHISTGKIDVDVVLSTEADEDIFTEADEDIFTEAD